MKYASLNIYWRYYIFHLKETKLFQLITTTEKQPFKNKVNIHNLQFNSAEKFRGKVFNQKLMDVFF